MLCTKEQFLCLLFGCSLRLFKHGWEVNSYVSELNKIKLYFLNKEIELFYKKTFESNSRIQKKVQEGLVLVERYGDGAWKHLGGAGGSVSGKGGSLETH